jgi:hypothetical protein
VIPRCVVANHGDTTASPSVVFNVFTWGTQVYCDSLQLPGLAPAERETVCFAGWCPQGRDSMDAVAWTVCAGDTFFSDDTCKGKFLVRVKDIAVTMSITPAPHETLDSGAVVYPQCRVWNYGNMSLNFDVRFTIGGYQSTGNVDLMAGGSTVVTAPDSWVSLPGMWVLRSFAIVPGDLHPENNIMIDTFWVRGTIRDSLWVKVLMPDTIDTTPFAPMSRVGNCGSSVVTFWSYFHIRDSAGSATLYSESTHHMLGPGDETDVVYRETSLEPGAYLAVAGIRDPIRDILDSLYFWVVPMSGIQEGRPQAASPRPQPTVLHRLPAGAIAFDAIGRRVLAPKSGVFFIAVGGERSALRVRKVVMQR